MGRRSQLATQLIVLIKFIKASVGKVSTNKADDFPLNICSIYIIFKFGL